MIKEPYTLADADAFRAEFFLLCDTVSTIAVTAHYSPDGDSISSVLAARAILMARYPEKTVRIIYTGVAPERFAPLPGFASIEWVDDIAHHLEGVQLLVVLDVSRLSRVSYLPEAISSHGIPMVAIDHHASAPDSFTLALIDASITSNAETIYRALDAKPLLTKELAEVFLLGILEDTGNFAFVPPSQSGVLLIAKDLIEIVGVPIDSFRSRFGGIPRHIIPLLQELVKNTSYGSVAGWPDYQYAYISREVLLQGNYTDEDMSAASHIYMGQYLPRVRGYNWGFVITPRTDGGCRMSARSLPGSVNVRDVHERLGIGGGHDRAAGGYVADPDPLSWVAHVEAWMKSNTPLIG